MKKYHGTEFRVDPQDWSGKVRIKCVGVTFKTTAKVFVGQFRYHTSMSGQIILETFPDERAGRNKHPFSIGSEISEKEIMSNMSSICKLNELGHER